MIDRLTLIRSIKLSEPAQRAFAEANIITLEDVAHRSIDDLLSLHGVGPKTIRVLTPILESLGLSFKT